MTEKRVLARLRSALISVAAALAAGLGWFAAPPEPKPAVAAEAKPRSPDFERFRFSFFEDRDSPRNGLDTRALLRLTGEERALAEDMLIHFLPDSRAIIGLSALRSRRAAPNLIRLYAAERIAELNARATQDREWSPYDLVWSAKALWRINPDPGYLEPIIETLGDADNWVQRETAAEQLFDVATEDVKAALIQALDDPEALVRYHAARALLATHGISVATMDPKHMMYRVMSKDPARREGGKDDILAAISGRPLVTPATP